MEDLCHNPQTTTPFATLPNPAGASIDTRVIDIYDSSCRMTYDIIGEFTIDHSFNALGRPDGPGGELLHRFERMQQRVQGSAGIRSELGVIIPGLDLIWV